MRFLCEQCKAKYQIADEKVAGKTVRMKCRKCGHLIEVKAEVTETSVASKAPPPPSPVEVEEATRVGMDVNALLKSIGPKDTTTKPAAPRPGTKPGLATSLACDSKYLSRALVNVVRNAGRYARSRVRLTVERRDDRTVIVVDDDGPGVPAAQRERLFEPFTRAEDSRGRESGGVGLGLAIVKSVAEWHGGEARISDSPLGGARVSIAW